MMVMMWRCRWNREILSPIQKHGNQREGADAYTKLGKLLRCDLWLQSTSI